MDAFHLYAIINAFFMILIIVFVLSLLKKVKSLQQSLKEHLFSFSSSLDKYSEGIKSKFETTVDLFVLKSAEKNLSQQKEWQEYLQQRLLEMGKQNAEHTNRQYESLVLFREKFLEELKRDFARLNDTVEKRLHHISQQVNENLEAGLAKTRETFTDVMKRLTRIDEAQKKIEQLSHNVVSLQDVLTDKKSRGVWGEVQLGQILSSVFGEQSPFYSTQYKLEAGHIVDAMLFLPEPMGKLAVDSKFPLENYKRMHEKELHEQQREEARREFRRNIKKHVDDIAQKYIVQGETAEQAILFLPAEAIFSELHAYFSDVIEYSNQKRVWITSPTTFMAVLSTVQVVINNKERTKYAHLIHEELNKLSVEFTRYQQRWDKLASHIETVNKDVKDIHITTDKINDRFQKIAKVELEQRENPLI